MQRRCHHHQQDRDRQDAGVHRPSGARATPRRWLAAIRTCLPPRPTCGIRTAAEASGCTFIALSRREVRTEHVERPFKVRQAFADLGAFPSCFGQARVDPVIKPTEPGDHGCSGGDTDGDDSDQHCDPFNRQRNPPAAQGSGKRTDVRARPRTPLHPFSLILHQRSERHTQGPARPLPPNVRYCRFGQPGQPNRHHLVRVRGIAGVPSYHYTQM